MTDRREQKMGNYWLVRLLGSGGFADVYLGEHLYLGTKAAIKLLHTHVAESEMASFLQEGRMLADLVHPAIVRMLDFGIEDHTAYLAMEYAPGGTLRTRHPRGMRLPLARVVDEVSQIGQALQYAHDLRVIHRDVKPENMLIGSHGQILLSDFGIALMAQSSRWRTQPELAGTIAYMAPEQIEGHACTASDQYALGIVVYEWLCGQCPFSGSFAEIAVKHCLAAPPPLTESLPWLPPAVQEVILMALAKKPEARFASVGAFVQALLRASASSPQFGTSQLASASSGAQGPAARESREEIVRRETQSLSTSTARSESVATTRGESVVAPSRKQPSSSVLLILIMMLVIMLVGAAASSSPRRQRAHPSLVSSVDSHGRTVGVDAGRACLHKGSFTQPTVAFKLETVTPVKANV